MRILILGTQLDQAYAAELYKDFARFFKKAAQQKHQVKYSLFIDLWFEIDGQQATIYDTRNDCDLNHYDTVFIMGQFRQRLDFAYVVSRYLKRHHKKVINDYSTQRTSSKLSQAYTFSELGLPTPYTICGSHSTLLANQGKLKLPFIGKEVYGSHGQDNHLFTSKKQLAEVLGDNPDGVYALQEYIENDGDYRILLAGAKQLIIKRTAPAGSHLNNTSRGGIAKLVDEGALPADIIAQARRCRDYLGMTLAGVDVLHNKLTDDYLFLEVNSQPQLVTGAFVTEKQQLLGELFNELSTGAAESRD